MVGTLRRTLAAAAAIAIAACAPAEGAAPLRIDHPVLRDCAAAQLVPGTPGVASTTRAAEARGLLTARLDGGQASDWDLALFSAGDPLAASTAFGSDESASAWVERGDEITIQACRRDGDRAKVPLAISLVPAQPGPGPRASLVSVPVSGANDVRRLEALGLDVTHDVSPDAVSVVLHGDGDRDRLAAAGFGAEVLVPDLAAADAADRAAERRATSRSALPSGRDAYRQYVDFTDELKALALSHPALVRPVQLGFTLEGRPIEGVEIATEVLREDDGRPVLLNLGAHHAREWPSAEFPMEFALELVTAHDDPGHPLHARVLALLGSVRVVIVPVVNVDGFLASRSFGTSALDEDEIATLPQIQAGTGAYRRKNCRPLDATEALIAVRDARQLRGRPQPQLRLLVGRAGQRQQPDHPELPRDRALLRAGDSGRPRVQLGGPSHRRDLQPHVHGRSGGGCASRGSTRPSSRRGRPGPSAPTSRR